ncbi:MAG: HlyD family efflux transporter periplasmic adaptor subunit, partial [Acidobacteriota bacterium]
RSRKLRTAKLKGLMLNPMFVRIPLIDPDRFLCRWLPYVRPFFSWWGALLWLATVASALGVAASHWGELTEGSTDLILAPANLPLLWVTFAAIKTIHEFGHAFCCRAFGGEVNEMGIMLLIFTPVPYVETSSSWAFPGKSRRLLVASAGMIVELFVASLAVFVWAGVEPGIVRSLAYNAIFLASVTTILFNANPLLRYDGYYILADALEMPNLRSRSTQYVKSLFERHLFGLSDDPPTQSVRERLWLFSYAVGSVIYRFFLSMAIILFVSSRFFFLGVLMGAVVSFSWLVLPMVRSAKYVLTDPRLRPVRARAVLTSGLLLAALLSLVAFFPAPLASRAEGVIHLPHLAPLRPASPGFVEELRVEPGSRVVKGEALLILRNPLLESELERMELRLEELRLRYNQALPQDRVQTNILEEQIALFEDLRRRIARQVEDLVVTSPIDGVLVLPRADDLPGRYIEAGETIGQVIDFSEVFVRTVIAQHDIQLVQDRLLKVEVRLAEDPDRVLPAEVERVVPAGDERLPSPALGSAGGGQTRIDPLDPSGARALEPLFVLDLRLPQGDYPVHAGGRAYVRFDLGREAFFSQWSRQLRQLLLDRFSL